MCVEMILNWSRPALVNAAVKAGVALTVVRCPGLAWSWFTFW